MERQVEETVNQTMGKAEQGYDRLRGRLNKANENLQEMSETARDSASDALENTLDWIRDNPGTSLGIALLVGAGVGALITAWAKD